MEINIASSNTVLGFIVLLIVIYGRFTLKTLFNYIAACLLFHVAPYFFLKNLLV
jgi:hypothetical protein